MTLAVRILSSDTPDQRAANLLEIAGLTKGDPAELAVTQRELARGLSAYMEVDGIAYDAALDSYRSYYAAIAAIRKQRESDVR